MSIVGVACGKAGPKHHPLGWTIEVPNATLFFCENSTVLLKIINISTKMPKSNKNYKYFIGPLATTTNTSASRRRAVILAPPSPEPGKICRSRACCSRQMGSCRAKAPKDHRTRAATTANDDNHRSKESDLKPHNQTRKTTGSRENRRTHNSTCPPSVLDAPPEDSTGRNLF
jgi:hypothetical protein